MGNKKMLAAIAYFEDAVRESDEIIADCTPALQAELAEQKWHFEVALEAMCSAPLPDNKALTAEELRGMDGEPVWCAELECGGIISVEIDGRWKDIPFLRGRLERVDFEYEIEKRGLTLYRRPPEKGE